MWAKAQQAEIQRILRSTGAQAKLTIGRSSDKYEQEEDRVAVQVMPMPDPKLQRKIENEEEEETLQAKPLADHISLLVQRQEEPPEEEEEQLIQAKTMSGSAPEITPEIGTGIQSLRGGGRPLSRSERCFFEPRFGVGFGDVRVHNNTQAAQVARLVNTRAFAIGRSVVFGAGEYSPDTLAGRKLLAHELTHVVQQNGRAAPFSAGRNSASVSINIQRKVNYISQVTGKPAKTFFLKFDNSVNKIASLIKGQTGPEAADLHQALAMLKDLRAKGKVPLWHTSGGLHYASYDNGEIRLHVVFGGMATASGTLVHEAIHTLHAIRFLRLQKMYAAVLAAKETTDCNKGILLLKYKGWTEYWAYRKAAVFENLRQAPHFYTDPHKSAMSERDVKRSIKRVSKETGKAFEPWRWNPPAKYKAVKSKCRRP